MDKRSYLSYKYMKIREKPWSTPLIYALFLVEVPVMYFLLWMSPFFETNDDSARYVISSIIQSEAAIIAVVVTLSLVAVQLTASYHSQSVTDLFRSSPHLRILTSAYITTMVFDIIILKTIGEFATPGVRDVSVNLVCVFGTYCFMILIPYLFAILELLRPSAIVGGLLKGMTRESFLQRDNPFEDILRILEVSVSRNDHQGIRDSLEEIEKETQYILAKSWCQKEEGIPERFSAEIMRICSLLIEHPEYFPRIIEFLSKITRFAINESTDITLRLMEIFNYLIERNDRNPRPDVTSNEIWELLNIVMAADERDLLGVAEKAISSLKRIALSSLKRHDNAPLTWDTIQMYIFVTEIKHMLIEIKELAKNGEIRDLIAATVEEIPDPS